MGDGGLVGSGTGLSEIDNVANHEQIVGAAAPHRIPMRTCCFRHLHGCPTERIAPDHPRITEIRAPKESPIESEIKTGLAGGRAPVALLVGSVDDVVPAES